MTTSDGEAALEANEAFYRAFNTKDVAAMTAAWSTSDEVTCLHPGWNILRGDEVMLSWRNILANPDQPRIVTGGASVVVRGDVAVVLCRELVGGGGLAATNVFVREEGAWRLLHHHSGPVAAV